MRSLDSLRGLAALTICLSHGTIFFNIGPIVPHSPIVVDFFFTLSSFILSLRYMPKIEKSENDGGINIWQFAIVRIARLYPLYLLALLLGAIYILLLLMVRHEIIIGSKQYIPSLLFNIFIMPYNHTDILHDQSPAYPFATQSWSVYWQIAMSLIFFLWVKSGKKYIKSIAIISFIILSYVTLRNHTIDGGWQIKNFYMGGIRAIFSFSIGIICANIVSRLYNASEKAKKIAIYNGYLAFIWVIYYIAFYRGSNPIYDLVSTAFIIPAIIIGMFFEHTIIFNNKIGDLLGQISYSTYLLHGIWSLVFLNIIHHTHLLAPSITTGLLWLTVVNVSSYPAWKYFEVPTQKWIKDKFYYKNKMPNKVSL